LETEKETRGRTGSNHNPGSAGTAGAAPTNATEIDWRMGIGNSGPSESQGRHSLTEFR
jgi:hypothetical protein